jgi:hypothetical protein
MKDDAKFLEACQNPMKRETLLKSHIRQRSVCRNIFLLSLALVFLSFILGYCFQRGDQVASTHFMICVMNLALFIHSDFRIKLLLIQKQAAQGDRGDSAGGCNAD